MGFANEDLITVLQTGRRILPGYDIGFYRYILISIMKKQKS